jgi:hypothetical protein
VELVSWSTDEHEQEAPALRVTGYFNMELEAFGTIINKQFIQDPQEQVAPVFILWEYAQMHLIWG